MTFDNSTSSRSLASLVSIVFRSSCFARNFRLRLILRSFSSPLDLPCLCCSPLKFLTTFVSALSTWFGFAAPSSCESSSLHYIHPGCAAASSSSAIGQSSVSVLYTSICLTVRSRLNSTINFSRRPFHSLSVLKSNPFFQWSSVTPSSSAIFTSSAPFLSFAPFTVSQTLLNASLFILSLAQPVCSTRLLVNPSIIVLLDPNFVSSTTPLLNLMAKVVISSLPLPLRTPFPSPHLSLLKSLLPSRPCAFLPSQLLFQSLCVQFPSLNPSILPFPSSLAVRHRARQDQHAPCMTSANSSSGDLSSSGSIEEERSFAAV